MILTCPNCATQYAVKDGAIPAQGRKVRCAACGDSWHQDSEDGAGETTPEPADPSIAEPVAGPGGETEEATSESTPSPYESIADRTEDEDDEGLAEASLIEPRTGPEAEERAFDQTVLEQADDGAQLESDASGAGDADRREPPEPEVQSHDFGNFDDDLTEPSRRKLLPLLLVFLTVAILTTLFWFLAPAEWKSRLGLASHVSPLELVTPQMQRQPLESGNELLTVTGGVVNPTGEVQDVPPLTAKLRTREGRVVHSWTIAPPARTIAPGGRASFNSSEVNVPPGGEELTITLGGNG
ncbi:MAG: zinc-ribbon domain-containing protein [Sphingomicrobium sp.]